MPDAQLRGTKLQRGSMSKKRKITACEAKQRLRAQGIDFKKDFFVLRSCEVELVLHVARAAGYQKAKSAPGSRGRMYYQYLKRQAC